MGRIIIRKAENRPASRPVAVDRERQPTLKGHVQERVRGWKRERGLGVL